MPLSVTGAMSRVSDAAAMAGVAPNNTVFNSQEQVFSPIAIRKGAAASHAIPSFEVPTWGRTESGPFGTAPAAPGAPTTPAGFVGPTRSELDPYFSNALGDDGTRWIQECDYQLMMNDGVATAGGKDLNIRKTIRGDIENVTAVALRGPLMLSGWGYDVCDRPTPSLGDTGSEAFEFDENVVGDRGTWKTGPVNLQWDDERKVWQGGPQIVCGVATGSISAPVSPCKPTKFSMKVFRKTDKVGSGWAGGPDTADPPSLDACLVGETITCMNRDPSLSQAAMGSMIFVVAVRINYEWIPIWVGCPESQAAPEHLECASCT